MDDAARLSIRFAGWLNGRSGKGIATGGRWIWSERGRKRGLSPIYLVDNSEPGPFDGLRRSHRSRTFFWKANRAAQPSVTGRRRRRKVHKDQGFKLLSKIVAVLLPPVFSGDLGAAEVRLPIQQECGTTADFLTAPCIYYTDYLFAPPGGKPILVDADRDDDVRELVQRFSREPWAAEKSLPQIGLALSGGGSKMAPFGVGVLKRFADQDWLQKTDLLSSVSGGGYAAYFLYSKAWERHAFPEQMAENRTRSDVVNGVRRMPRIRDFFADIRYERYAENFEDSRYSRKLVYAADVSRYGVLPRTDDANEDCMYFPRNTARHQSFIECYQDVLSFEPGGVSGTTSNPPYGAYIGGGAATLLSLPFHHFANSFFDWKLPLSPSQHIYQSGIGRTYGTTPDEHVSRVAQKPRPGKLGFPELLALYADLARCAGESCVRLPWWIINSTNAVEGTWGDLRKTVFEVSPNSFGSGTYGYVVGAPISVLKADFQPLHAVASSAAFFDSLSKDPPFGLSRETVFLGLHAINLRWGLELPNYRVSDVRRYVHALLPWPLYYLDPAFARSENSTHIRIADGGHSGDNLGLFSLLRRGTRHIAVADGAFDRDGQRLSSLDELCLAATLLAQYGLDILFEGKPSNPDDDRKYALATLCREDGIGLKEIERREFSPYHWKRPVWVGTVAARTGAPSSPASRILAGIKIYYIKSAVDAEKIVSAIDHWRANDDVCDGNIAHTSALHGFPCGLIGYRIDAGALKNPDKWEWPQTPTVGDTADGSANRFEAYRDLGWIAAGHLACMKDWPLFDQNLCDKVSGR